MYSSDIIQNISWIWKSTYMSLTYCTWCRPDITTLISKRCRFILSSIRKTWIVTKDTFLQLHLSISLVEVQDCIYSVCYNIYINCMFIIKNQELKSHTSYGHIFSLWMKWNWDGIMYTSVWEFVFFEYIHVAHRARSYRFICQILVQCYG